MATRRVDPVAEEYRLLASPEGRKEALYLLARQIARREPIDWRRQYQQRVARFWNEQR